MTDSSNPYQPPGSDQPPDTNTPSRRDLVAAVILATLSGVVVFLGTCFGTGLFLFGYSYPGPAPRWVDWVANIMIPGCILLGAGTGLVLGRMVYNARRRTRADRSESDEQSVLTNSFYDSRAFRPDHD